MRAWIAALALLFAAPAAAQIQDVSRPGTVAHPAARTGFPEQVGEFRRAHVLRYGENNLSANYDLRRGSDFVRLSIYIYPSWPAADDRRAATCREEMAATDAAIARQHPGGERTESGEAPALPGTEAGLRLRSLHRIPLRLRGPEPEPVRSESRLYCYVDGNWQVKYRISSNLDFDVAAAIDAFVRDGPWPNRGPAAIAMR
jgi:hypothetical protein